MVVKVLVFLLLCGIPSVVSAEGDSATNGNRVSLANFDTDQPLTFPQNWKVHGDEEIARHVYKSSRKMGTSICVPTLINRTCRSASLESVQAKEFPALQWRWRAKQLPIGANERAVKTNDSVAGVYVIFDSTLFPRAIKYVWSSSLPIGARFTSPVYWRSRVVVLQSGPTQANEWKLETVNFYHDYKALFGTEPSAVLGFAILTDSDTTDSIAEADYDDFAVLSVAAALAEEENSSAVRRAPATAGGQ